MIFIFAKKVFINTYLKYFEDQLQYNLYLLRRREEKRKDGGGKTEREKRKIQ